MSMPARRQAWAILRASDNVLDGASEWLEGNPDGAPVRLVLFHTRREARAYVSERLGYIVKRPDLRREPHGWKIPRVVRVSITVDVVP